MEHIRAIRGNHDTNEPAGYVANEVKIICAETRESITISPAELVALANYTRILAALEVPKFKPRAQPTEGYDYTHQAWVRDGVYVRCGHPALMQCGCYGRIHQGEPVAAGSEVH